MTLDRKHLVLLAVVIILALFGVYAVEARIADKAEAKAELASQRAADLEKANATFQAQTQAQLAALQTQLSERSASEAKLATQSGSLTAPQVATQIATVAKVPEASVTSTVDSVTFPLPLAQAALTDMQLVPLLTQDKSDLQKSLDLEKQAHVADNQTCKAQMVAAEAKTNAVVAQARKGKLKWFLLGVVAGFTGRGAI